MLNGKIIEKTALQGNIQSRVIQTGGGSGTSNYPDLKNLPSINDVELVGNKTSEELGLANKADIPVVPTKVSEFENDAGYLKEVPSEYITETELNDKGYATTGEVENAVKDKATTDYVDTKVADLVNSAPETLDTLGEVAKAIEDNADVVDALNGAIGNKADKTELADYVKNTDYGTGEKAGIFKLQSGSGIWANPSNHTLHIANATNDEIVAKTSEYKPIVPYTLDYAVKVGLTTNTETLTDEEKAAAKNWLGIESGVSQEDFDKLVNNETVIQPSKRGSVYIGSSPTETNEDGNCVVIGKDTKMTSTIGTGAVIIGYGARSVGTSTAIGNGAICTKNSSIALGGGVYGPAKAQKSESIQFGTGTNDKYKTLQVWSDNIYNGDTHTLTVQNIELNGEDIKTLIPQIELTLKDNGAYTLTINKG